MRQFFFWTHFVIAFCVAIFVFLMSATGVLLTYEAQISRWARNAMVEIPVNGEPLSIDDLAETAHASGINFRRGLPNTQARNFNWHHVFGVWAVLPLLAVVLSGVVLLTGQQVVSGPASTGGPRPGNGSPKTLEELAALVTEGNNDWNRLSITLPEDGADVVEIAVDTGNGIQTSKIETFMVARDGSSVVDEEDDGGSGIVSFRFFRFLHTGEIFGAIGQTIAGLASLAAVFLAYTGISLGLGRLARMWRPRRHQAESARIADGRR